MSFQENKERSEVKLENTKENQRRYQQKFSLSKKILTQEEKLGELAQAYKVKPSVQLRRKMVEIKEKIIALSASLDALPATKNYGKNFSPSKKLVPAVSRTLILSGNRVIESHYPKAMTVHELKTVLADVNEIVQIQAVRVNKILDGIAVRCKGKPLVNKANFYVPDFEPLVYVTHLSADTVVQFTLPDKITLAELEQFGEWVKENHRFFMEGMV
ncbi:MULTISPECIES: hypothetical protein [Pseudomonas]|uniref:Uncharacterized protein n=1 Tax=Pseudomonas helleri TaxID=1608996 RepID=A0A6L5HMC3_9PSED|nr:hypothetical protein [Pseudomonas helleri]MQU04453.1 hypothetical protein [Pseudomonas helleri]